IPSRVPYLLIADLTYSTLGNDRLLSGVIIKYSNSPGIWNTEKRSVILTFTFPHGLGDVKFNHKNNRGYNNSRENTFWSVVKIRLVLTPDAWFTAPRLRPPLTGIDWKNEDTILQTPRANIS
ncbi:GSCOCG00000458001-RA-CDS, partial [Cotesia congregata]